MQGPARWFSPYAAYEPRTRAFRASLGAARSRCLVLEKGNTVQKLFGRYLGEIEVVPVGDSDQAAAELARSPAQLLVVNHPQASELLQALSARSGLPLAMPVVAFWLPGGEDYADYLGVMKYLVKPVSKDVLLGALEELGDGVRQVLLVDDNPEVLQLFGRILSFAGRRYSTLRASSSEQALEMLRERRPDLMILDLIMPEMTGFAVLEAKAKDPAIRDIPVFVVTAQDPAGIPRMSQAVTLAKEGGFSPRDLVELARSVSRQLEPAGLPS
jgi:CheY-like chemotaxis protein